ncbi:hypothetical protein [Neomegalonema sp.]|uniref:hypothetical protein n=1 Tax=Neomegalonema sp. TaxID=2039713 RepID=UPI00263A1488|nr:hypothetical protein [Neomegalonema sp.]MDD2870105.1 hypothetical protein [Neomegalonema sp.]
MGWPQWVFAGLLAISVIVGFMLDGEPRDPWSFTGSAGSAAILALLLHAGDFWR